MRTRHSFGITRRTAEQLLDGTAGPGPEQVIRVLRAATGPAREGELAGGHAAMAAFEARARLEAIPLSPVANPRKRKMINLPLAKLLTVKVVAWSLAGMVTVGAAAAGTVALSSSGSTSTSPGGAGSSPAGLAGAASASGTVSGGAPTQAAKASASASLSGSTTPGGAVALCTDLASRAESILGQANGTVTDTAGQAGLAQVLASPTVSQLLAAQPFSSLISLADSATAVPDYCGLLLSVPAVPVPTDFTQLPASVLTQALGPLPATDLTALLY